MAVPFNTPDAIARAPFKASGSKASFLPLFALAVLWLLLRDRFLGLRLRLLRLLRVLLLRLLFFLWSFLRWLRLRFSLLDFCLERDRFGDLERDRFGDLEREGDDGFFVDSSCFTLFDASCFETSAFFGGDASSRDFLERDFERERFSRLTFFSLRLDFDRERFFLSEERERFLCFLLRAFRDFERERLREKRRWKEHNELQKNESGGGDRKSVV